MDNVSFKRGIHGRYDAILNGQVIGWARYKERGNYISMLHVNAGYRRSGVASSIVRFISSDIGRKLNRAPSLIKNKAIHSLSAKLGDELLKEAILGET